MISPALQKLKLQQPPSIRILPKRTPPWGPYVNAIATATVYVNFHVALDAVWCATFSKREEASINQEWLSRCDHNIESVAVFQMSSGSLLWF